MVKNEELPETHTHYALSFVQIGDGKIGVYTRPTNLETQKPESELRQWRHDNDIFVSSDTTGN